MKALLLIVILLLAGCASKPAPKLETYYTPLNEETNVNPRIPGCSEVTLGRGTRECNAGK